MFARTIGMLIVGFATVSVSMAEEYHGQIVKVDLNKVTIAVTWRGDTKKNVDPPVKTEFMVDPNFKVLGFKLEELKDGAAKFRIFQLGQYVIVQTEKREKGETIISVRTLPGANAGG